MARTHNTGDDDEKTEHEGTTDAHCNPAAEPSRVPDSVGEETGAAGSAPQTPTESELEAQGFTPDEVDRLNVILARFARSEESRDAEAMLRRLRFARWLIERGLLDEWSA